MISHSIEFDYGLAFVAGVLGSSHCVGMCGALVSGFFMKTAQNSNSYAPYFAYHLTRILVYTLVGMLAASLGVVLVSSGMFGKLQAVLQLAIGLLVIVLALGILGVIPWQGTLRLVPMTAVRRGYAFAATRGKVMSATMGGAMNGLMPCPLTFAMAIKATSASSPLEGGLLMLIFGAGTFPTMVLVSIAFGRIGTKLRGYFLKSAALVMVLMGLNTLYKGLSFYMEEDFKHRTFFHILKESIVETVEYLAELLDYIGELINNLQQ